MVGEGLEFSAPLNEFFGFVVMLTEIIFGLAVLTGFNVKYTAIPLIIIIIVAALGIHVPNIDGSPMVIVIILLHLVTLAALIHIALTGPGSYSVEK
jgi:uncharacterized membrane protein YphA (DoxX/SURF4 family)